MTSYRYSPEQHKKHLLFHFMPERNVVTSFLNSTQILQQQKFVTDWIMIFQNSIRNMTQRSMNLAHLKAPCDSST